MIFCIGNGKSRDHVDLDKLENKGLIFGCNALYRDFTPDNLVTNDNILFEEIVNSGYSKENIVYVCEKTHNKTKFAYRNHKIYFISDMMDIIYPINSGICTIRLAHSLYPQEQIYLLGYDVFGERNNIYDWTSGYQGDRRVITAGHSSWEEQWKKNEEDRSGQFYLLTETLCPGIKIKRVTDDERKLQTIENITYEDFYKEIFRTDTDLFYRIKKEKV